MYVAVITTHPPTPAAAATTAAEPPPASTPTTPTPAATGGTTYVNTKPATLPANNTGECRNWVYAHRATIDHTSTNRGHGRTPRTPSTAGSANPTQIRPPLRFTTRANEQSSITARAIEANPPARSNAPRRNNTA